MRSTYKDSVSNNMKLLGKLDVLGTYDRYLCCCLQSYKSVFTQLWVLLIPPIRTILHLFPPSRCSRTFDIVCYSTNCHLIFSLLVSQFPYTTFFLPYDSTLMIYLVPIYSPAPHNYLRPDYLFTMSSPFKISSFLGSFVIWGFLPIVPIQSY